MGSLVIDANDEEDIVLCVGDRTFQTTRSTLRMAGLGSFLHTLATADTKYLPTRRNAQGHLLIDRDGALFEHILNSLRQGPLHPPLISSHDDLLYNERGLWRQIAALEAEARFYTLRGWPLVYLLGHPLLVRSSRELSYESLPPTNIHERCWKVTVETNVDEEEMHWLCFWVPDLASFEIELSVSRKRSTVNSGHALIEGWGIDVQTSILPMCESTNSSTLVPSASAPWRLPPHEDHGDARPIWFTASTDRLILDAEIPRNFFDLRRFNRDVPQFNEKVRCVHVLPKRPPTAKMPAVQGYTKDGNNVHRLLEKTDWFDWMELWPEPPMLWVPWNGHSYSICCGPLAEAVSAGMRIQSHVEEATLEDTPASDASRETYHWVSSNPMEWNICFLDPHAPEGQEGLAQKCPPQPRQTLALCMSESVLSYELLSGQSVSCHCKALPSCQGQIHLRFSLRDPHMAEAVLVVKVRGHAE